MAGIRWVCLTAVLLILPVFAVTAEEPDIETPLQLSQNSRDIDIPYAETPPVLDGYLESAEWQTYITGWYFDAQDGMSHMENYSDPVNGYDEGLGDQKDISAVFYAQYDDDYLYIAANVTDDTIVVDSYPLDPTKYYRDDGIEILIDGAHDRDIDQRAGDPWPGWEDGTTVTILADNSYHSDYSDLNGYPFGRKYGENDAWYGISRADFVGDFYVVEMRIRLENISSPLPNSTIGLNIGINDDDNGALSKTALKWAGGNYTPVVNDIFKNETKWGSARFVTNVNAVLDKRVYIDEDVPLILSGAESTGNHPDFLTGANYTWTMPFFTGSEWRNVTMYGETTEWMFTDPLEQPVIQLTVTDPAGISDSASVVISVNDTTPPLINAIDASAMEEEPFVYTLNATDNGVISGYEWSLLDGVWYNMSTDLPSFTHTFQHPGIFAVHVWVFDEFNNSNEGDFSVIVNDSRPPIIVFDHLMIEVDSGETIDLDAGETTDDNPNSHEDWWLNYTWRFVLGSSSIEHYGSDISIALFVPGLYVCNLTVTDFLGFSSFVNFSISVRDVIPPLIDFNLPAEIVQGTSLNLTGIFCSDDDLLFPLNASFRWEVTISGPDLSYSMNYTGIDANVNFPYAGGCFVKLSVIDAAGNMAYLVKGSNITDNTPPIPRLQFWDAVDEDVIYFLDFIGSSDNIGITRVHFLVLDLTREREYHRSPAGGIFIQNIPSSSYDSMEEFLIRFDDPGDYAVVLTVYDGVGLNSNITSFVTVRDTTRPDAVSNKTYVVLFEGEPLLLNGGGSTDNHGSLHYYWTIQETLETFDGINLEVFLDPGEYNITLRVTDDGGNYNESHCTVIVKDRGSGNGSGLGDTISLILWILVFLVLIILLIMAVMVIRKSMNRISPGEEMVPEPEVQEE